jgi:hypothetical protein
MHPQSPLRKAPHFSGVALGSALRMTACMTHARNPGTAVPVFALTALQSEKPPAAELQPA